MNGTPARRGPGGFPQTPGPYRSPGGDARSPRSPSASTNTPSRPNVRSTLSEMPQAPPRSSGPLISTAILDAAQQRFYLFAFYVLIWAWRLYDFFTLLSEDDESLTLCLKWCFVDMCFIFGVPLLEIPWLEWSNATAFVLFLVHAGLDVMLMFRIGVPLQAWLVSLAGFLWDSELAISERSVKPGHIIHNASLILGKQIINILPEGSAILNPSKEAFCLNSSVTHVDIPILVNQTEPVEMELLRIDFDTNHNETITIKKSELKAAMKKARKSTKSNDPLDPLLLHHSVKKPGVYMLRKVIDSSKLEVRPRSSTAVVVACPQARVKPTGNNRCRNDLSQIELEVEGTPPLHIKYTLIVNGKSRGSSEFHNLLPEDFVSPLSRHSSQALIKSGREDVSWVRSQKIGVPLNEALGTSGKWEYAIEEVSDGLGNHISYVDFDDEERPRPKLTGLQQSFDVHERPKVRLRGCSPDNPLRVAQGTTARLPIVYGSTGKDAIDAPHHLEYLFTPQTELLADGHHSPNAELKKQTMRSTREQPVIMSSGLYTLKSVSTEFCEGEVLEPTSCLLQNPPRPELSLSSEDIIDKCAGNPIGLRVGLDLIGSPPFVIEYTEQKGRGAKETKKTQITSLRGSINLKPKDAGHYTYTFESIEDAIYPKQPLSNLILQQNVKPSANAHFISKKPKQACIDDAAEFGVELQGEGPWKLEYEVVHNGRRTKRTVNIEEERYYIQTDKLKSGGEYIVALASITDKMGCKEFLKDEAKVYVRNERPKAYFGQVDGKRAIMALEGKKIELPLRVTGEGPWEVRYQQKDSDEVKTERITQENAAIIANAEGTYKLLSVNDAICPGFIDEKANMFSVNWIPRPRLTIPTSASLVSDSGLYVKNEVCEGEEDSFEVNLSGHPPFDVSYRQDFREKKGGKIIANSNHPLRAMSGSAAVRADTSRAGLYEYTFQELSDSKYAHSKKHFSPVTVQQTVNPRPNAKFTTPGKTYSYCSRESEGEEVIPLTLEGVPPFELVVGIKHHGSAKAEYATYRNIPTNKYDLKIEHRKLQLGHSAITISQVRDARGCSFKLPATSPRVQISVHDAPTATPLEDRTDFCVGERLSFALGGQVPFTVYYTFEGQERKASNPGTTFRRLAELPGTFTITGLRDSASECLAALDLQKQIHPIPSVRLSGGQVTEVDIHEGGGTDLVFEFWGTPPFEFTYTRSTNAHRGKKSKVLEIRTEVSHEHHLSIPVQEEGTYEVVSIKDRWCSFAKQVEGLENKGGQKLLTY
ncbi:hypothetical protein BS50DRAFT_577393 [Corynespora cassiicola Philippines]|uniref:Nucleoporin Pom152 n=1 Tax=Corynespora cassiicola Philippines TaxID=1448308 RepID=A0A2T2NBR9_CORCC|nr:hypothetical protein BS50DRAFT_577393 [Corynespora cassiicola Philippines]